MTTKDDHIPNSFQTPNIFIDKYLPYLTGPEVKTLFYAIRRIYGFQKRTDRIALSQFLKGIKTKSGKQLDGGTGLSRGTQISAISQLVELGLLIKVSPNDPKKNQGAEYGLEFNSNKVNLKAMAKRADKRHQSGVNRTEIARIAADAARTPVSPTDRTPVSPTDRTPVSPTDRTPVSPTDRTPVSPTDLQNPVKKPSEGNPEGNPVVNRKPANGVPAHPNKDEVKIKQYFCRKFHLHINHKQTDSEIDEKWLLPLRDIYEATGQDLDESLSLLDWALHESDHSETWNVGSPKSVSWQCVREAAKRKRLKDNPKGKKKVSAREALEGV